MGFPESVLDDGQDAICISLVTEVEREAYAVGHGAESSTQVELLLGHILLQVPQVCLVGCGVHRRQQAVVVRRHRGLLVRVLPLR